MKAELGSKRSWPCSLPLLHMSAGSVPASRLNELSPTCTISIPLPAEQCSPVTFRLYYSKNWVFIQNSASTCSLAFHSEKRAAICIFRAFSRCSYPGKLMFCVPFHLSYQYGGARASKTSTIDATPFIKSVKQMSNTVNTVFKRGVCGPIL